MKEPSDRIGTLLSHPFDPILFSDTKILILGTFPSIDSFKESFYYAHRRNQFWSILSSMSGYPVHNRDQKIWLLKRMHWGLWDMVAACSRKNSLDSSLRGIEVNDIPKLLHRYPSIQKLLFTGRKAEALFEKHFPNEAIERDYLPSPSGAFASMSFEEKLQEYRKKLLDSSTLKQNSIPYAPMKKIKKQKEALRSFSKELS